MANVVLILIGIILLGVGFLYFAPMFGMNFLPFALPDFGFSFMGISAIGAGLLGIGIILFILGMVTGY